MLMPIAILVAIMGALTAPGLIAQSRAERRARKAENLTEDGTVNA
ncbi:hypothetical protein [Ponticaulis profundi]|uniref:Uncharacterized protein n=1 Tax=Ponticaulis profundi TaxID=2665222 RepID=A0ABW1S914_9PROT|tara:strand:- start:86 stop:220 length:135 start_codon:yes stop_codon:yes gene_type:complete